MIFKRFHLFLLPLFAISVNWVYAQSLPKRDTSKITLVQAEQQFLTNNLDLLAQRYNVEQAKAEIITAGLFDNPQISFENVFINPKTKQILDFSKEGGQYTGSISQLIRTAGKRNKSIQLAKVGVQQSEDQLYDLLRTLKYTLRNDFFKIYFQEQSVKVYDIEITTLTQTLEALRTQYQKGNIAEKEVLRIQSQLYTLQAELNSLRNDIDDNQSEFKLLIRAKPDVYVVPQAQINLEGRDFFKDVPYQRMLDSAYQKRFDLKLAEHTVNYNNVNLQLQKANAIPDVTLSLTYDKQGSYLNHYNGLGISVPLPVFNRNQGVIKQAKLALEASKFAVTQQREIVESELDNSFQSAVRQQSLYNGFDPRFKANFSHLIDEVSINFKKRNISLLEFLDFYDSYKENTIQLNNLQTDYINSLEQLNYVTGTHFFN